MRPGHAIAIGTVAAILAAATGCSLHAEPAWYDQLQPDSPCYRVNLLDGLDESSTAEVHDLFDCLDAQGQFDSFGPAVDALDVDARSGDPAGIEIARSVNGMIAAHFDVFGVAGVVLDFLQAPDRPADKLMDLSLEAIYARPAPQVRAQASLTDADALRGGLLAPLSPVVPAVAGAVLDDDLRATDWAGGVLQDPETKRWVRGLDALTTTTRSEVASPVHALLPDLGDAIEAAHSPGNDRWGSASGDSVRDAASAFVLGVKGEPPVLDTITPMADEILGDGGVRREIPGMVLDLQDGRNLTPVPSEVKWLASVDRQGGTLQPGEASALAAMIRLLDATNRPMDCSIDLGITTLDVSLGNLGVSLMRLMADMDPNTVQSGAGLLGTVLGWGLTDSLMTSIADSGVCPALTRQVVGDLHAIDVMSGDRAHDVLVLFVHTLHVLEHADHDEIPAFVDLASALDQSGAVPPVEEALRDLGDEPLMGDLTDLLPVLVDPSRHGITAGQDRAPDLHDALGLAEWLFARRNGRTGWETVKPLAQVIVAEDGTWDAVAHAGPLLADRQTQAAQGLDLVGPILGDDPDLVVLDQVGVLLADRDVMGPLLRTLETPGVGDGLLVARPVGRDPEVPLAFGARLVVNGALQDLLRIVDLMLGSL